MRIIPLIIFWVVAISYSSYGQLTYAHGKRFTYIHLQDSSQVDNILILDNISPVKAYEGRAKVKFKLGSYHFKKDKFKLSCDNWEWTQFPQQTLDTTVLEMKGKLTGKNCDCIITITVKQNIEQGITLTVSTDNGQINRLKLYYSIQANSKGLFGFGEQFSYIDMEGRTVPIWVEEQGLGRGDKGITWVANLAGAGGSKYTTSKPLPRYISTNNTSFELKNFEYAEFDFPEVGWNSVTVWSNYLKAEIRQAQSPKELLGFWQGNGMVLPDWAFGTWLGLQGGKQRVDSLLQETLKYDNPVTVVWTQDWVGKRPTKYGSRLNWDWHPDSTTYPNLNEWIQELNAQGIKYMGYINPFLAEDAELAIVAKANDFLVKNEKGQPYLVKAGGFNAYMVDLSNPATRGWMKGIIKYQMIELGMSGWMADFGEWLPPDAVLHNGMSAIDYHHYYMYEWVKLNREAIIEAGKDGEIVFFNRSGYTGSERWSTAFWMADQMHSYGKNDGLPATINALNSSGMSGITINHSDIGGYTTVKAPIVKNFIRDEDLLFRWAELNAFTPIFRTHEGLKPNINTQSYTNTNTQQHFAKMGRLHHALLPYFKHLNQEARDESLPFCRHPYLVFPDDEHTRTLQYQFLLGDDLLVLPVIKADTDETTGYFPEGKWENIWTGEVIEGPRTLTVKAPYGQPAAYYRVAGKWYPQLKEMLAEVTRR